MDFIAPFQTSWTSFTDTAMLGQHLLVLPVATHDVAPAATTIATSQSMLEALRNQVAGKAAIKAKLKTYRYFDGVCYACANNTCTVGRVYGTHSIGCIHVITRSGSGTPTVYNTSRYIIIHLGNRSAVQGLRKACSGSAPDLLRPASVAS